MCCLAMAVAQTHQRKNNNLIICPFLGTMVNEGVLPVRTQYSRDELMGITLQAGLSPEIANAHLAGNFLNNPSGIQDIFNMEGATNEHDRSTGIHDCVTSFTQCNKESPPNQRCTNKTQTCAVPNRRHCNEFFRLADTNCDGQLTQREVEQVESKVTFNDANPIGAGTIPDSFSILVQVFGGAGNKMSKRQFEQVNIERRFPSGYVFSNALAGVYTIKNVNSGKYLSVDDGQKNNGANIVQFDTPHEEHSQWVIQAVSTPGAKGAFTVQNVFSNKYLNVAAGDARDGANVHQWDNPDRPETQWKVRQCATEKHLFENLLTGKFMNVDAGKQHNGGNVHMWSNPDRPETQWVLERVTLRKLQWV